jgi:hypothetical protein
MKTRIFKAIASGLVFAAFVLAFAGAASADVYFNLNGTSEEFTFWTAMGSTLLTNLGCQSIVAVTKQVSITDVSNGSGSKSGIVLGNQCSSLSDQGYLYFTYTNKASWDGIDAVNNVWDGSNWGTYNTSTQTYNVASDPCASATTPDGLSCSNHNCRKVAYCVGCATGSTPGSTCEAIQVGASNLEASGIIQKTQGNLKGPVNAGQIYTYRQFPPTGIATPYSGAPSAPLAYPFAFYVNPGVKAWQCVDGGATLNQFCNPNASPSDCTPGTCTWTTINNISRVQAVALFSGQIKYWGDFGPYFSQTYIQNDTSLPVTLCLRHAGSGTHSVLDIAVMKDNGFGTSNLAKAENRSIAGNNPPYVYFNDLSSDETACLAWASGLTTVSSGDPLPTNYSSVDGGAIGYVDADTTNGLNGSQQVMYYRVQYNGVWPTRGTMDNGIYDDFWTIDRLYPAASVGSSTAPGPDQGVIYNEMLTLVANPANICNAAAQCNYYGSATELNFTKGATTTYPYVYTPAANQFFPADVEKKPVGAAKAKKVN